MMDWATFFYATATLWFSVLALVRHDLLSVGLALFTAGHLVGKL